MIKKGKENEIVAAPKLLGCLDLHNKVALIRVLRAAQDPRALAVEHQARRWLLLRANNIADEAVRRSFLERVPANRALMELTNGSATL